MAKKKPAPKVPSWRSRLIKDDTAKVTAYDKKVAAKKAAAAARKKALKDLRVKATRGVSKFLDNHVRGKQGPKAPTVKSHTRTQIEQSKARQKALKDRNARKAKWAKRNQPTANGPHKFAAPKLPKPAAAAKLLKIRADKKKAPDKKSVQAKKVEVKAPQKTPKPTPTRQPVRKAVSSSSGIQAKAVRDQGSKKQNLDAWAKANPQLAKDLAAREDKKKKRVANNIATGFKSSASKKSSIPTTQTAKKTDKSKLYSGGTGKNRNRIA